MLNAHEPASTLAVVMRVELKGGCVSPAFVIGCGALTRAFVFLVIQPAAMGNTKYGKKVRQQLHPRIDRKRECDSFSFVIGSGTLIEALVSSVI